MKHAIGVGVVRVVAYIIHSAPTELEKACLSAIKAFMYECA